MIDLRKIGIIFVIAVLYTIFVNAFIDAIYERPRYEDFCPYLEKPERVYEIEKRDATCPDFEQPGTAELKECREKKGENRYEYDANGCPISYECDMCRKGYDEKREHYGFWSFIISSIAALIAIAIGLFLPAKKNTLNEWVGTGFVLGGLITLFVGTARYYGDLHRIVRPIILFIELVIVIYIAYKKLKK